MVLAAGRSSRMGTSKALLPIGRGTAIERVVSSLRAAGAGHVVVVTGHGAEELLPVLRRMEVDLAHNPDYDLGMFSSVQTGVAALGGDVDAFFVLPVDCPLVTPRVLGLLLAHFERGRKGIVYPVCCARRGHPPLLSARYLRPLLDADRRGSLQAFLSAFPDDETDVDVRDITVLMDMDTPEEHAMLGRFAAILDGATPPVLTADEALFILTVTGTPANIVQHSRAVAAAGAKLAEALKAQLPALDVALVRTGCLLHDLARLQPNHAVVAQALLTNLGLPRLGVIVGQHMVIEAHFPATPGITEAELVYLADKLVADDELVGVDEREARTFRKMRPGPEGAARIRARTHDARAIAGKVEAMLGRPLEEVLGSLVDPADQRTLQVFVARHAESLGGDGRRFLGQADPALGSRGEEQARRFAEELMAMTGGACFDAIYGSDLQRCLRTADIVAERCGTTVQAERWLREIDVGLWEGLTWEEARQAYPVEHAERERDVVGQPFPGGESFKDLWARVVPGFLRLIDESLAAGHRRVLVVGHKGVNRVILAHMMGLPLEDLFSIEQDFCAVAVLEILTDASGRLRVARK